MRFGAIRSKYLYTMDELHNEDVMEHDGEIDENAEDSQMIEEMGEGMEDGESFEGEEDEE